MNKYKVEITKTYQYVVDILAEDEQTAQSQAYEILNDRINDGTQHYLQNGDDVDTVMVYDVTNTDDPFSPENV